MLQKQWWIATGMLAEGGEKILGPFGSQNLALDVRTYVEKVNEPVTYWVDSEYIPTDTAALPKEG